MFKKTWLVTAQWTHVDEETGEPFTETEGVEVEASTPEGARKAASAELADGYELGWKIVEIREVFPQVFVRSIGFPDTYVD
jgi:hypothetical protein